MLVQIAVEDVMSRDVAVVAPETAAREVARTLRDAAVGAVIVDADPQGIVTQTDIVDLIAADRDTTTVRAVDVMSSPLVTIAPEETIEVAAGKMDRHDIKRLAVTEGRDIVGIITTDGVSDYVPKLAVRASERTHDLDSRLGVSYAEEDWEFERIDDTTEAQIDLGDTVRFTKRIDDADVQAFARASGDTNRLHLDETFADETQFGERIVHGVLAVGLISAALARLPGLTIYLSQDISFREPIAVGETVTAMCEFVDRLGDNRYRLATRVYGEDGSLAIDGTATVLVQELPD